MSARGVCSGSAVALCCVLTCSTASAQITESTGSRALGMGGAFVAVASDSSAIWWNPAGLAAGPFLDLAVSRTVTGTRDELPARRETVTGFALATPPLGIAYSRFSVTSASPIGPTGTDGAGREDDETGVPIQMLSGSQIGVTFVQSLTWGVHAGATVKFVRGTPHSGIGGRQATPSELLETAEALPEGSSSRAFDLDVGLLAVAGPLRLGARVRNLFEPEFDHIRLPRQTRVGIAFDPELTTGIPLTVAIDADVDAYTTLTGERRVVAVGAEYWALSKRVGVRAGGRVNTVGARERAATAGASVAVRPGIYVDAYAVGGGAGDERGWGLATRVSF